MIKSDVVNFEGKLALDSSGFVILETKERSYYPLPYPPYAAVSIECMKMEAVVEYREYVNKSVTMAGFPQNDLLFDARVIRTLIPRDETKGYGEEYWNNRVPKADILFTARKLPGYAMMFPVDVCQMITINDSVIRKELEEHELIIKDTEKCNEDIYRIYRHSRVKESNPYFYEYDNYIFGCEFFMYPYELRVLKMGDCDDWGIELASYLISAGVPLRVRIRRIVYITLF